MDKKIFDFSYGFIKKNRHLSRICDFAAKASSVLFFAVYAAVFLFMLINKNEKILLYTAVPFSVLAINLELRRIIKRPRPLDPSKCDSFPSNHAASSGIIAFACLYVNTSLGFIMLSASLLTCALRLFTGRHYLTDILCGFTLSAVFSLLFHIG